MTESYKRLKLMAEVQCWAIWDMDGIDNIDPATLSLPEQLVEKINEWSDRFDAIYELDKKNFHTDIGFESKDEEDEFYDDGWKILNQLNQAMSGIDWWYRDKRLAEVAQRQP